MTDFASKWKYDLNNGSLTDYAHIVDEAMADIYSDLNQANDSIHEESDVRDFDFSSFQPQEELNPKVWPNGKLNSKVRLRLMDIGDDFVKTLQVSWVKPLDMLLTGSMANYNWSRYSDFDLHILMDFSEVDEKIDFVHEYFTAKKKVWNSEHENLRIYGFPVEVYVQDVTEDLISSGIYSLYRNEWIETPEKHRLKALGKEKEYIKTKSIETMEKIDSLYFKAMSIKCDTEGQEIYNKICTLFRIIKNIRKTSLANDGEMSEGNIFFKILRRTGYIERLLTAKTLAYDRIESID